MKQPETQHPPDFELENIDLSQLPSEIVAAIEQLARRAHEVWVHQRMAEGWHYAPSRDDELKKHPHLIPYEKLSDLEKEYVRNAVLETLHGIVTLGYRIEDTAYREDDLTHLSDPADDDQIRISAYLDDFTQSDLTTLLNVWGTRNLERWARNPRLYRSLGDRILQLGEPLLAYDVVVEGLGYFPGDVRLRQLFASALSQSGATERANTVLARLLEEGHHDEETLSMLARTHKDLWSSAINADEKRKHLLRAFELYNNAHQITGGYYSGINAATMALLADKNELACQLAREVQGLCLHELDERCNGSDCYWPAATLAQAALILGEWSKAGHWYMRAAELGRGKYGQLSSTRHNAQLILDYLEVDQSIVSELESYFRIPKVVVFAGHMIDHPDRSSPRFPPELESIVADAIRERLYKIGECIGYASAACGADILFLEALLEHNREIHIVLPFDRDQFKRVSVEFAPGSHWGERFDHVLRDATEVIVASEQKMAESSTPFEYTNQLLRGLATMRSKQLQTEFVGLAVWDGKPGDGLGGTATVVDQWRTIGLRVEIIDLQEILRLAAIGERRINSDAPIGGTHPALASSMPTFPAEIIAILFADAVGFSKLTEEEVTLFVRHFLGEIGELAATSDHLPVMKNTWGDGLYLVFTSVRDAGLFALDLYDQICKADWQAQGLPATLNLRIALHAGPAYACTDPITGRLNYIGSHVSHASRIEPITPPGQVYTSQAFAALAAAQQVREFTCEYVGRMPLAKGRGTFPTYLLRRWNS